MQSKAAPDYSTYKIRQLLEAFETIDDRQNTRSAIKLIAHISKHFQIRVNDLAIDHVYPYQVTELISDKLFAKTILGDSFDLVMGEIEMMQIKLDRVKSSISAMR